MSRSKYSDWTDRDLVEELAEIEEGLSDWEVAFVDSVHKLVIDQKGHLSTKAGGQRDTAVQILDRLKR